MASRAPRGRGREHPALRRGLRVDRVGTEAVVLDPIAALVHRLTGPSAEVIAELVMRGRDVADLPSRLAPAVAGLREAGVLRGEVSRRQALGTAAVGAVGIMTMRLPAALAAASPGGSGDGGGTASDVSTTGALDTLPDLRSSGGTQAIAAAGYTYRVFSDPDAANRFDVDGSGTLTVDVLVVGAGGAGGDNFGGGGGGGAVSLLLARDTGGGDRLSVSVGTGGGRGGAAGDDGGSSGFGGVVLAGGGTVGGSGDLDTVAGVGGNSPTSGADSSGGTGAVGWFFSAPAGKQGGGGGGAGAGGNGFTRTGGNQTGGSGGYGFPVSGFFDADFRIGAGGSGGGSFGTERKVPNVGGGGIGPESGQNATSGVFGGGGGGGGSYVSADEEAFPSNTPGGQGGNGVVIVRYLS